jgi:hypothetical protein
MTIIKCDAKICNNNSYGKCMLGSIQIDATEFNNDPSCPPICLNATTIDK